MLIKSICSLLFSFVFIHQSLANPLLNPAAPALGLGPAQTPVNPLLFQPNFSAQPRYLPPGSPINFICSNPANVYLCASQLNQQAISLSVAPYRGIPQYSTYVPVLNRLTPSTMRLNSLTKDRGWEEKLFREPVDTPEQRFFVNEKRNQTAIVDQQGDVFVGKTVLIDIDDVIISPASEATTSAPTVTIPVVTPPEAKPPVVTTPTVTIPEATAPEATAPEVTIPEGSTYIIGAQGTQALPTTVREVQPGCFVIQKPAETQAGFCLDCGIEQQNNSRVFGIISGLNVSLHRLKEQLQLTNSRTGRNIEGKTGRSNESYTSKICSPETHLSSVIRNFERTCPSPYNGRGGFKKFFKSSYCNFCKNSVPPELMLALMSIESAGVCNAENNNSRERSMGLFQINSEVHSCQNHTKNTAANRSCLRDPVNNMNESVSILKNYFKQVNSTSSQSVLTSSEAGSSNQCNAKSWLQTSDKEKDSWRRAVSGYNSGPRWVTRAIASVRDERARTGTGFLQNSHRTTRNDSYKEDESSWEELRIYYFLERLNPRNTAGSGRQIDLTQSNIAYVESILGRNIETSRPSMIELWSQYKINFLKENGNTINCQQ